MRIPTLFVFGSLVLVTASLAGCGGDAAAPDSKTPAATAGAKPSGGGSGKVNKGDKIPSFSFDAMNGVPEKVKVNPGKVTVVDLWATWCDPCKKSFPKLQELYVKYKGQVEFVAISVDDDADKGKIPDFAKTYGAKFPVGWGGKALADQFAPDNMPSSYIVGKDGVVKFVHKGYHEGDEAEVEKELKSLL